MHQETPNELFGIESDGSGPVPMFAAIVLPLKGDAAFGDAENAVVGQRHAVGVAARILNRGLRPSERFFRIDHPFGFSQRIEKGPQGGRVFGWLQLAEKLFDRQQFSLPPGKPLDAIRALLTTNRADDAPSGDLRTNGRGAPASRFPLFGMGRASLIRVQRER